MSKTAFPTSAAAFLLALGMATSAHAGRIGYLYATTNDHDDNEILVWEVDSSGFLTPVAGSPFATGGEGASIAFATTNVAVTRNAGIPLLYATNPGSGSVSAFTMDTDTGALTAVAGSPFDTDIATPGGLAITSDGECLFTNVASDSGDIESFSIAAGGVLTSAGTTAGTGQSNGTKITPDDAFLVVARGQDSQLSSYAIDADCSLQELPGSPFTAATNTVSVEFNSNGTLLFASTSGFVDTIVGVYDFAAGVPTPIAGSPFTFDSGDNANVAALRPLGDRLYVTNQSTATLTVLEVEVDGTLALFPGSPFSGPATQPCGLAFSQDGGLLFTADRGGGHISVFTLAPDGTPAEVAGSSFVAQGSPNAVAFLSVCDSDGTLDAGEFCDDGNLADGDGCSGCRIDECWSCAGEPSECSALAGGTACTPDSNECTSEECDGAGICGPVAVTDDTPCDDEDACTLVDTCDGGTCMGADQIVCCDGGVCHSDTGVCEPCPEGYELVAEGCRRTFEIDDASDLDSMVIGCGAAEAVSSGGAYGFQWNDPGDAGVGGVLSVDVRFETGISCAAAMSDVFLNDSGIGQFSPVGNCACGSPHAPVELAGLNPALYVVGGINQVEIADPGNFQGFARDADGNFAVVHVVYARLDVPLGIGTPCNEFDTNPCTDPRCDGAGSCVAASNTDPCDDGSACTTSDHCSGGVCAGGAPLSCNDGDLCTRDDCHPVDGCTHDEAPANTCSLPGAAALVVIDKGDGRGLVKWLWKKGAALGQSDLGAPDVDTTYTLCVYDTSSGDSSVAFQLGIDPGTSWRSKAPSGWTYKDPETASDGVLKALLKTGAAGSSRVKLVAKGNGLPDLNPAGGGKFFNVSPSLTVQLFNDATSACFSAPFTAAKSNTEGKFVAKF